MKSRGQASIEFILLIVVILLYLQTVVQPTVSVANISAQEVNRVGKARSAAESLANTIKSVSLQSSQSKQTIQIFVPAKAELHCKCPTCAIPSNFGDLNAIEMIVILDQAPPLIVEDGTSSGKCRSGKCYFDVNLFQNTDLNCGDADLSNGFRPNVTYSVSVRKDNRGMVFVEI